MLRRGGAKTPLAALIEEKNRIIPLPRRACACVMGGTLKGLRGMTYTILTRNWLLYSSPSSIPPAIPLSPKGKRKRIARRPSWVREHPHSKSNGSCVGVGGGDASEVPGKA